MLYLASKSPRRRQLLAQLGLEFETVAFTVAEVREDGETPLAYVRRVARDKAREGARQVPAASAVLAADTEVVLGDRVFGQPRDELEAREMIESLVDRTHEVLTAIVIRRGERERSAVSRSEVRFGALSGPQIRDYCASGEWQGKAGGYGIQGRAGAFVKHLNGSYSGVVGLPLYECARLMEEIGA